VDQFAFIPKGVIPKRRVVTSGARDLPQDISNRPATDHLWGIAEPFSAA
jgi:hypothetical protein